MKRRQFIALLGGAAAAWPLVARAQPQAKIPRIGFLGLAPEFSGVEALRAGLRDLGYIEGTNIVIEWRWAEKVDQLPELAAELVGIGHVASLARPSGNVTGLSMLLTELAAKGLEMMKEAVPHAARIGVLWNPTTPSHLRALKAIESAAEKLSVELHMVAARTLEDFDGAFSTMAREATGAFLVVASPLIVAQRVPLAGLALKHRLPGMFPFKENVEAGGLMSYGADRDDLYRRAATYVDKILKGVKPADLPVEQASKYQLVINLKTAKAVGLDVPPTLLARADEVIE